MERAPQQSLGVERAVGNRQSSWGKNVSNMSMAREDYLDKGDQRVWDQGGQPRETELWVARRHYKQRLKLDRELKTAQGTTDRAGHLAELRQLQIDSTAAASEKQFSRIKQKQTTAVRGWPKYVLAALLEAAGMSSSGKAPELKERVMGLVPLQPALMEAAGKALEAGRPKRGNKAAKPRQRQAAKPRQRQAAQALPARLAKVMTVVAWTAAAGMMRVGMTAMWTAAVAAAMMMLQGCRVRLPLVSRGEGGARSSGLAGTTFM
jgi:hypothetical protein